MSRPTVRSSFAAVLCMLAAGCGGGATDATVGGTLTGLSSGSAIVVQNNSADSLTLSANGTFEFDQTLDANSTYSVTVLTQPPGQTCLVSNASGTIDSYADSVTDVAVICVTSSSIIGTVSGLPAGTSVTLSSNGALLPIASNGSFSFPGVLTTGSTYNVTIAVQPAGHACVVANGTGIVQANTAASVTVTCS